MARRAISKRGTCGHRRDLKVAHVPGKKNKADVPSPSQSLESSSGRRWKISNTSSSTTGAKANGRDGLSFVCIAYSELNLFARGGVLKCIAHMYSACTVLTKAFNDSGSREKRRSAASIRCFYIVFWLCIFDFHIYIYMRIYIYMYMYMYYIYICSICDLELVQICAKFVFVHFDI